MLCCSDRATAAAAAASGPLVMEHLGAALDDVDLVVAHDALDVLGLPVPGGLDGAPHLGQAAHDALGRRRVVEDWERGVVDCLDGRLLRHQAVVKPGPGKALMRKQRFRVLS